MHGGAVTLAGRFLSRSDRYDFLLATDMLDLTTFLALARRRAASVPTALYFHENQLTYPWSPADRDVQKNRDHHYGFINYASALAADAVYFNSAYHLESFFAELPRFLRHFPDERGLENIELVRKKSRVLPLGLDLARFDDYRAEKKTGSKPLILWNHRWEFDKNPEEFFQALFILAEKGVDFQVAILGECFSEQPEIFTLAKEVLTDRVVQFGYCERFSDYAQWLWKADVLPVTSHQDFFGASVVEAIYCGCVPLLPKRLSYPALVPSEHQDTFFYDDFDDLVARLEARLAKLDRHEAAPLQRHLRKYDWSVMAPVYDSAFDDLVASLKNVSGTP